MKKRHITSFTAIAAAAAFASTANAAIVGTGNYIINEAGNFTETSGAIQVKDGSLTIDNGSIYTHTTADFRVAHNGSGAMTIASGGQFLATSTSYNILNGFAFANTTGGLGIGLVTGANSLFHVTDTSQNILLGRNGTATGQLTIEDGGMVMTAGMKLTQNADATGTLRMGAGGILAILGTKTLDQMYYSGGGTTAFQYDNAGTWAPLTTAQSSLYDLTTYSTETFINGVDVDGYTVLTMNAIPEPTSLSLLALGGLALLRRRRA